LIQIPSVLTSASAEQLHRTLSQQTPWTLSHNIDGTLKRVRGLTPQDRMMLALQSRSRAQEQFTFFHDSHELSRDEDRDALVAFLNGPELMRFVCTVTGMTEIKSADATAMLFRPGDFLTRRDGTAAGADRVLAYELSLTPAWNLDWGGILSFVGETGHITKGYVPTFNTLTLFSVPRVHFVSQVALHGGLRYSVGGWLG
jgi:Rps23 Pro-64 3,4-dihydroxylase Tpa1-like proline 4-hydroxylase